MNRQQFAKRREKLRSLMRKAKLTALLVTMDANRYYLSGFELHDTQNNESSGCLVIAANGKDWLCTDSRYEGAAERLWEQDRIFIYKGNAMAQVNSLLKERFGGAKVGFEAHSLSVSAFNAVGEGIAMQRADGMVEALRLVKEPEEIAAMQRSCALNHQLMSWVPGVLVPGRSEAAVAWDIEQFFRNNGAEELAFAGIVAVDGNAALPHAEPGSTLLTDGCAVLVDVGCRLDRYCSDQTRSFWVGSSPDPGFTSDLALIQEAQRLAIKAIRPGIPCSDVAKIAAGYLDQKGVGRLFTHSLGHGIGLQTHEAPRLSVNSETVLRPGMVVTVEPGLYRPGQRGVRWGYMVVATEEGHRVL